MISWVVRAELARAHGHAQKMDFVVDKRTKERTYDWELIGKLKRINS